jgi:hypothetical protein
MSLTCQILGWKPLGSRRGVLSALFMRDAVPLLLGVLGWCWACAPDAPSERAAERCKPSECPAPDPLPARVWKLSHAQYTRSVQQFLGVLAESSSFQPELDNGVYPNMSGSGMVDAVLAHDYYDSAEQIASQVPAHTLAQLAGGQLTAASKSVFLPAAIRGAFRRPATSEDLQAYGVLFDAEPDSAPDGSSPFRAVVRALLSSPYFLYRTELGSEPAAAQFSLTPYELASFLSFSLQDSPPSAALSVAAESGALSEPGVVAAQIDALLDTPEATDQLRSLIGQWLEIHSFGELAKDTGPFPEFEAHKAEIWNEAMRFIEQVGSMSGSIAELLTTPVTPSDELFAYYSSEPSAFGSVGTRTGVLGLGAVIAAHSRRNGTSPTLQGLFVRERMLCQSIHLPLGGVPTLMDTLFLKQPRTTRELYSQHAHDPVCASCHVLLDSIGFNFENFDATGRYRTLENGVPIDTTGELVEPQVGGPTRDHSELAERLAQSDAVRACFARQVFRFYVGLIEPDGELPALRAAADSGTLRDLVATLMHVQATRPRARQTW